MAHIRDVRKLNGVVMLVTTILLLWFLLLRLQDTQNFEWFLPRRALDGMSIVAWTWLVVLLLALAAFIAGLMVFSIPITKDSGRAVGGVRQVQCQKCSAVFRITDNGRRPLTHSCPSCNAYGIYDGTVPPVGEAPVAERVKQFKKLELTCKECQHEFHVTDTGARPLRIQCPGCDAIGQIR